MATERIQIVVSQKGAVTVKRDIADIGDSAKKSVGGINALKSALSGVLVYLSASKLIEYSDSATRLANSLKIAGLEGADFSMVQERLYNTAIKNGQQAEALSVVYQKLSSTSKDLGINTEETISTVEGIAAAMKLSTAGTSAQAGALQQLSQLFGGTVVQAQEYNSLIDGAYPLLQAAARGIEGMDGSVSKLTQTVKQGGFSTKTFFDGLRSGLEETKAIAADVPLTIGQSFVALEQSFTKWLATSSKANVVAVAFASVIQLAANNVNTLVTVIGPLAAAFLVLAGYNAIAGVVVGLYGLAAAITTAVIPAIAALSIAILTNPIGLIAVGIAAVLLLMYQWRDSLGVVGEWFQALHDKAAKVINNIKLSLMDLGIIEQGRIDVVLTGTTAAGQVKEAFSVGAYMVELKAKKGVDDGGTLAAAKLKGGVIDGASVAVNLLAQAQQSAIANYEQMNGVAAKTMGESIVTSAKTGADYTYNQVTGAVEKAAPALDKAVNDGGAKAGQTIEKSMQRGAATVYSSIESAFASLAPLQKVFDAFASRFRAELRQGLADLGKTMAEQRLLNAQADLARAQAIAARNGGSGGGGGDYGGGSSTRGGGEFSWDAAFAMFEARQAARGFRAAQSVSSSGNFASGGQFKVGGTGAGTDKTPVNFNANRGERVTVETRKQQRKASASNNNVPEVKTPITVTNVISPQSMIDAMSTKAGQRNLINVIKINRDQLRAILG